MAETAVTVQAPAKINLYLKVLGKRPDGFHEIQSLVQAISLYDTITLSETEAGVELSGDVGQSPGDSSNLVCRAVELLKERVGFASGINIGLTKRIPIGAGLGGGSSDAAAVLKGVNRLLGLQINRSALQEWSSLLGSDVPFFFSGGSAIIGGRGEQVENVDLPLDYQVVLVAPDFAVATAEAYSRVRISLTSTSTNPTFTWETTSADLFSLPGRLGNDFEGLVTVSHPSVSRCMEILREAGARAVALSGSGSAFFGLFERAPDPALEMWIAERFGWRVWIVRPVKLE